MAISGWQEIGVDEDENFAIHFKGFRRLLLLLLLQPRGTAARHRTAACHTAAAQTIKKSLTKKCPHFPTETLKTGHQKVRKGFENPIPELSYLPIEVVVEIWNFGGVELVGGVSSVGNCWAR